MEASTGVDVGVRRHAGRLVQRPRADEPISGRVYSLKTATWQSGQR